ncbi:MAG: glycosyltransferase family 39 protein [Pseudomonadota bacterium]
MRRLGQSCCETLDRLIGGPPWRAWLLLTLLALATALPGIAALPVTDRDEARFAQATKQMLETGDYIDIRFQDAPRWKKPIGIYWLQAGTASLAGEAEAPIWAYRLPSALGAVAAVLLTAWAMIPLIGRNAALLAGAMLATTLLVAAEATIAKTDAALLATAAAALGALARALTGTATRLTWLVFWLAIAGAALLKGPIVPVVAALSVIWVWAATRTAPRIASLRPLPGLVLAAALVAPWLIAIWQISDGGFFAESVGEDLLGKVAEGKEKHWGPPGLYLALVWLTFWPWAAFLPQALGWVWQRRKTVWVPVLMGWVVPFWVILELVPTKLPHYVLPLYPALAGMVAAWVLSDPPAAPLRWRRLAAGLAAGPGVVLAVALLALPIVLEGRVLWVAAGLAALGALASLAAGRAALDGHARAQAGASVLAALLLFPAVLQFGLPGLSTVFPSPRIAALTAEWQACASRPLMSLGYREPSLVFLNGTETALTDRIAMARALETDLGAMALVEDRWRADLDASWSGTPPSLIERGHVFYFNYNRGKTETARLLTPDHPRWNACAE